MANSIFKTGNREAFDNQSGNNSDSNKSQTERKHLRGLRRITGQKLFFRSIVVSSILLVSIGVMAQTGLLPYITDQAVGLLSRFSSFSASSTSSKTSPSLSLSERYSQRLKTYSPAVPVPSPGGAGNRDTIGVFRPSNTVSYLRNTNSGGVSDISLVYGDATDLFITGDWDNDGIDSLGIYRNGVFYLRNANTTGGPDLVFAFGASGDLPIAGDWNADGTDTVGIFRPSTGTFLLRNTNSAGSPDITFLFGSSGDQPIAGDWDGDGTDTIGVFRSSTTVFYLKNTNVSSAADISIVLGGSSDIPVSGDWNNSGVDTVGLYSGGTYYLWNSNNGGSPDLAFAYGGAGDKPITGNWDGLPADPPAANTVSCQRSEKRLGGCNATGGTNLYSRNFSWGTGLAGLPGRSGLDAGFGLSYNSLVWIRKGSQMVFDPDVSNVSPGFRMGFPVIESVYNDFDTGRNTFIMVTPSGGRVEFRQVGSTNKYETPDSSYGELTLDSSSSITVRGTDGTQVSYTFQTGAFFVNQIKDSNGNYITVNHDSTGTLQSVTDTLGRTININHDGNGYPTTIQQTWKTNNGAGSNTTYTYATLSYTTIAVTASFHSSLTVSGLYNASAVTVLDKVTYPNGAYTKFNYNNFGQVWKVSNYAADNTELNHVAVNLNNTGTNLLDVPRFSQTKLWTKDFNNEQEVIIPNTLQTGQSYSVAGTSGTGTLVQVTAPDGTISKTYFHETGWSEGLPVVTEDWANSTRQRWTWTNWTQDNTLLSYVLNPRVTESKVGDNSNIKRTTVSYHLLSGNISKWGLVNEVKVYDADQTTVLKRSETTYNESTTYTDRRIIGLPSESKLYDQSNNLMSKVTYAFDEGNFNDGSLEQNISPIQHDNTNYGSSFITGRGNLTSTTRWDVTQSTNSSEAVTSQIKYNTAGSPVAQVNPLNNQVKLIYSDSFNDAINRSSYAYPTKVYDPAGNYSEVKYRFDIGANVWAKSPAPAGNTSGKETEREYDSLGRLIKDKIVNTGAYTRYEYPTNGIQSKVYSTITDTNYNNTGDSADEVLTEAWTDGAGRTLKSRTEHPGSTGGYAGSKAEYDIMGRVKKSSVPTEINSAWTPAGDDTNFLWTQREYDWKGRVTREINTDGTDRHYSFDGCGCAGGQVTTVKGELVPRDDQPTVNARRTQKVYADILGRTYKTEVLNWDGSSVYTTTQNTFNGRDQVTKTRQYAGTASSSTYQDVDMTYDGHGRLKTRHYPIEDAATDTTWIYNNDDSVQQIIDPRGAISNFTYNTRGLMTQISYSVPSGSSIPVTPTTSFTFDNLGNRTQMTDGTGTTTYAYDELSRLTSETKTFTGLTGNFAVAYGYQLSGKLKSITDPFGAVVNYNDDKVGRTTSVTGSGFDNVSTYADNIKYRAFGAVKQLDYGTTDNSTVSYSFDNRLRVTDYQSTSSVLSGGYVRKAGYEYFDDGKVKKVDNHIDSGFDQTYKFDHMGRLTANGFGMKDNNQSQQVQTYNQTIGYDAFGDMTSRTTNVWGGGGGFTATYINGRKQNSNEIYDAAGNIIDDTTSSTIYNRNKFDAAGQLVEAVQRYYQGSPQQTSFDRTTTITNSFDGDGRLVKRSDKFDSQQIYPPNMPLYTKTETEYFVHSSVLGKVLTELDETGAKKLTNVYTGKAVLAEQRVIASTNEVFWKHEDVVTGSYQKITEDGNKVMTYTPPGSAEFEALGGIVPQSDPNFEDEELGGSLSPANYRFGGDVGRPEFGCQSNGSPIPCNLLRLILGFSGRTTIEVNTRAPGGYSLYHSLRSNLTTNRYDRYLVINNEDSRLSRELHNDLSFWRGLESFGNGNYGLLVGSWFETTLSSFGEWLISRQTAKIKFTLFYNQDVKKEGSQLVDRIKDTIFGDKALSAECTKAFKAIGATPIIDQLTDGNVNFITESIFMNSNEDDLWSPDKEFATALREKANSVIRRYFWGTAITGDIEAGDITYDLGSYKGKRYIGLTNWGINEKRDFLSVTLIHALIHSGGIKGQAKPGTHDLAYLVEKYDAIIDACQKNKSKMKKAGGK